MPTRYDALQATEDPSDFTRSHEDPSSHAASESSISSAQRQNGKDARESVPLTKKPKAPLGRLAMTRRRIGQIPSTLLVLSVFGTAAFIAYITFLWFSVGQTWMDIALSGWTTRSIAIAAVVLRTSTTVQVGIASSMLAAIALESEAGIPLPDLAPISLMRASSTAPYALLAYPRLGHKALLACAALIAITATCLQFTSTILLADVEAGFIPRTLRNYTYVFPDVPYRGSLQSFWRSSPRPWPIFAESTKNNTADGSLGYSDTGYTMRALLPISDTQSRSLLHTYQGPAPVIDARTICFRPNITNTRVQVNTTFDYKVRGNITVPSDLLPTLLAETPLASFKSSGFACEPSWNFLRDDKHEKVGAHTSVWDLTICDIGPAAQAKIITDFYGVNFSSSTTPFLLINYTGYVDQQAEDRTKFSPSELANFNDTTAGVHYHNRHEWVDLMQDTQTLDWSNGNNFSQTKLSFSVCVPVFHAYLFNISVISQGPLEEPTYYYDPERSAFRYDRIRKQLLSSSSLSLAERNVWSLEPRSWLLDTNGTDQDYPFGTIYSMITLTGPDQILSPDQEQPAIHPKDDIAAYPAQTDINLLGLGLEILQEGATPAQAMQSMLMSVVLADYQQYVFTEVPNTTRTNDTTVTLRSDFVSAQVPGGNGQPATNPAGATRSYIIVMVATAVHSITVFAIIVLFIRNTKHTLLWESWHVVSQSISVVSAPYVRQDSPATDSEVKTQMRSDGVSSRAVAVGLDDGGVGAVRVHDTDTQGDVPLQTHRPERERGDMQ